jgi:hypothetical protein
MEGRNALAAAAQLGNCHGLVELGDRAEQSRDQAILSSNDAAEGRVPPMSAAASPKTCAALHARPPASVIISAEP